MKTEHQIKNPKVYIVKNKEIISFLAKVEADLTLDGFNSGVVDDKFIVESFSINNFIFYKSVQGDYWVTKRDLKEISLEMSHYKPI